MLSYQSKEMLRSVFSGVLSVCLLMLPIALGLWWSFPRVDFTPWRSGPPPAAWAHQRERVRTAAAEEGSGRTRFHYVPSTAIATDFKLAVLVGEDASFFSHGPLDYDAIEEALEQWWSGRRLRGASTISQQLVKNLFLSSERSVWRKIEEVRLAWWLERKLPKARVLELYLNIVEMGPGIYGVDAAARHYFDVTAAELNREQAVSLAATIPGPLHANPRVRTRAWEYRRQVIEDKMGRLASLRTVLEQQAKLQEMRAEEP